MDKEFFRTVMGARPALWQAILVFNGLQAVEGPQDATSLPLLESLTPQQNATLWSYPALRWAVQQAKVRQLWANMEAKQGAEQKGSKLKLFWDFAEESRRLALLPDAALKHLALVFGVATHATQLAQVVVRADRHFLQQELGEDMLLYALQRGRFQITPSPANTAVSGGAGGGTMLVQTKMLPQRIRDYGLWALHRIRADWPEELRARRNFAPEPSALAHVRAYTGLWNDIKKILLKEVAPSWTPCFD